MVEFDNVTLRFAAVLDTHKQVDADRRFVISICSKLIILMIYFNILILCNAFFYLVADNEITVFEPKTRDTGILGGKLLD